MIHGLMKSYLKEDDVKIKNRVDVDSVMHDITPVIFKEAFDEEREQGLECSKYDHSDKGIDSSCNEYSRKTIHTGYIDMRIDLSRDRNGEFVTQIIS